EQARDALRYCLRTLGPRDRFGIVAFSTEAEVFRETLRPADARDDGRYFVDRLEAGGGTNIHDALQTAAAMLDGSDDGLIVFLTDGLPSIGPTDEGAIRAAVEGAAGRRVRLFAFGVGYDVNTRLLDGLARDTGALADYISPDEAIDDRIAAFFDKIRFPVMTGLALDFGGAEAVAVVPGALPDLYRGQQLVVAGRYGRPGAATVTLRGTVEGEPTARRYRFDWPARERERDYVARLWATRRVGQLLEAIRLHGESDELKDEVVALAKEFGLVTPYTSYLVLEDDALANAPQQVRAREEGRMLDQAAPAAEALTQTSGRGAVAVSKQIRQMQEAEAAAPPPPAGIAHVAGRTLRQQPDGAWVDVEFDDAQHTPVRLRFASDAYFAFLRLHPEALPFARLGDAVTFFFEGRYVQVGEVEDDGLGAARLRALFGG
ncbi:MAG: VWA domain-containing protein, partial [Rhodothermales bacterium]|nr:VWA domain-containing protein [Rhodothermales bacterium]